VRIAITRPKERIAETLELVKKRGWEAIILPSIEIVPRLIDPSLKLEAFDWVVVTSASGADIMWNHFKDELKRVDIAVVGPKTRDAFVKKGIKPKVVSKEYVGEALAHALFDLVEDKKVLVARAVGAREEPVEMLRRVADVTELVIYDTVFPKDDSDLNVFKELLEKGNIDAIIFTSSLATKNLLKFLGRQHSKRLNEIIVCAIGPITARTVEELGIHLSCVPEKYTIDASLDKISKLYFRSKWI
jgi:uroporphyrinogen-III synthase